MQRDQRRHEHRGPPQNATPAHVRVMDDGRLVTRNLVPGARVYDEDLVRFQDAEWRTWNPQKSKIGAYLVKGGQRFPLEADAKILYLGAANGTTPSHVSDVAADGTVYAVEFSPRSFRDLVVLSDDRPNLVPFLADAWRPELYERFVGDVDAVFQDIAQRRQAAIFARNVERFRPRIAMVAVKSRSVDVGRDPRGVAEEAANEIRDSTGYRVVEFIDLGPFERDHFAVVFERPEGA